MQIVELRASCSSSLTGDLHLQPLFFILNPYFSKNSYSSSSNVVGFFIREKFRQFGVRIQVVFFFLTSRLLLHVVYFPNLRLLQPLDKMLNPSLLENPFGSSFPLCHCWWSFLFIYPVYERCGGSLLISILAKRTHFYCGSL